MNERTIERLPDLLRRLVNDFLTADKRIEDLERQLESEKFGAWIDTRACKPEQNPNARPFWATVQSGSLSRIALVAWFDDFGFCETNDIYAETYGEQVMTENITHWMPTNMPFYPATK